MKNLFADADMMSPKLLEAFHKVYQAFDILTLSRRPRYSKNKSVTDLNEALNKEVLADFSVENTK